MTSKELLFTIFNKYLKEDIVAQAPHVNVVNENHIFIRVIKPPKLETRGRVELYINENRLHLKSYAETYPALKITKSNKTRDVDLLKAS
jgi:hypothetical protein